MRKIWSKLRKNVVRPFLMGKDPNNLAGKILRFFFAKIQNFSSFFYIFGQIILEVGVKIVPDIND